MVISHPVLSIKIVTQRLVKINVFKSVIRFINHTKYSDKEVHKVLFVWPTAKRMT